jgi:hypothetical protein
VPGRNNLGLSDNVSAGGHLHILSFLFSRHRSVFPHTSRTCLTHYTGKSSVTSISGSMEQETGIKVQRTRRPTNRLSNSIVQGSRKGR